MEVPDQRLPDATFAELAVPLLDQLYNFAQWLTQDASEAEDLVQESYVKALRGFSGFQAGTNFRAWIFRILRNTFLTSRSGLKLSQAEADLDLIVAPDPSPEAALISKAHRDAIRQALLELPVPFREVVLLCDVEDMAYEEIAQVLSIPIGTVMSRLHRARKALRAILIARETGGAHGV
jgi:RNA polymerase sigma-70 factor, ECF subfamily